MAALPHDDGRIAAYLAELVARVVAQLGDRLVGVWLFGSGALGDFDPRRSDLDVQAVSADAPPVAERARLAAALSHERLACPVRGLEFVLYGSGDLERESGPAFALNLNTGPGMTHRVSLSDDEDPHFWFVLDVAIGREHGRPLAGPAAAEVFPLLPHALIVAALREALAWHAANDPSGAQAVLAACRARAWALEGRWLSKGAAAAWGREHLDDPAPVAAALALRLDPGLPAIPASDVAAVLARTEDALGAMSARPA